MAKGSDNDFPSVLFTEQSSQPASPTAGKRRLYPKTDHKWYSVDSAGTETEVGAGSYIEGARVYNSGAISVPNTTVTTLTFDSERYDTDNCHYTSAANLTGTVDKAAGSATLTGSGTAFLSELSVGQVISVPGTAVEKRVVTAVASDTSLTVNSAFANNASGQTAARVNSALVCRTPGKYLISGHLEFNANATGDRTAFIRLNGPTTIASQDSRARANNNHGLSVCTIYNLAQWDFVELAC